MTTEAEFLSDLEARSDFVARSDPFHPDGVPRGAATSRDITDNLALKDAPFTAIGAPVERVIWLWVLDEAGNPQRYKVQYFVEDKGGAGENVHTNPKWLPKGVNYWLLAEQWLDANAKTADTSIILYWVTAVDEDHKIASVATIYNNGDGTYSKVPFLLFRDNGTTYFGKDLTANGQ